VAASDGRQNGGASAWHTAAGGSLSLQFAFWVIPFTLQYQLSHRFTDDHAVTQLIQLGL
jgi:hypothetical protein